MAKAHEPRRIITTLEACATATTLLRKAGFEVAYVSMRSEAVYFRFPGRPGVLRVADHAGGKGMPGLDRVLAKLTFLPHRLRKEPDTLAIGDTSMHNLVCAAIGRYMIASNDVVTSTYHGPNAKNDRAASSNGRTPDFDSGNAGSTPAAASSDKAS